MDREGWSGAELSRQLSVSRSSVSERLSLLKLPAPLQEQVDSGSLSVREAYKRVRETGTEPTVKKKGSDKNKKRKRGVEVCFRTSDGAKIVVTFPRKVSESEIRSALLEAAEAGSERKAA